MSDNSTFSVEKNTSPHVRIPVAPNARDCDIIVAQINIYINRKCVFTRH